MSANTLNSFVELFQKNQFTKVLEIAAPIVEQNPIDLDILNIFGTACCDNWTVSTGGDDF